MTNPRIALIHATPLAVQPVAEAFKQLWPQARLANFLDDSLAPDLAEAGSLNATMITRFIGLAQYAKTYGANAILFTCSAFGPAIDEARQAVGLPTLKPNEAMFDEALDLCERLGGPRRIGLLTTFAPSSISMREELLAAIRLRGLDVQVDGACADGAMAIYNAGDAATHDRMIFDSARALAACDVVVLGQFSMARAQKGVADVVGKPVLTSPESAVRRLKAVLESTPTQG